MPNGGSDCCLTCWFNSKNKGQAGYVRPRAPGQPLCQIRSFEIVSPAYTYCANHPHRRPDRDEVPIGPVLTGDSEGYREVWKLSPDTEEIRSHLLALLGEIHETPTGEYPIGHALEEVVIWQLGEFRDRRAIRGLKRITE